MLFLRHWNSATLFCGALGITGSLDTRETLVTCLDTTTHRVPFTSGGGNRTTLDDEHSVYTWLPTMTGLCWLEGGCSSSRFTPTAGPGSVESP